MVDDDKYGLSFLRSSLQVAGFQVVTALSAEAARELLQGEGLAAFDAVLADYRMPGESGLDLLRWIRSEDATLSTIIVTAEGEKELVKQSLQGGAVGFLDKPVSHQDLTEAVSRAVAQTQRLRRFADAELERAAVGRLDTFLNAQVGAEVLPHLQVVYHPLQEIGGDFVTARAVGRERLMLLVGDVSGHSMAAGYVSAYFQGMVRSACEQGISLPECLAVFNRILCEEWGPAAARRGELFTSLAVATVEIDLAAGEMTATVAGFPPPLHVDPNGWSTRIGGGSHPLGWLPHWATEAAVQAIGRRDAVLIFSDGLVDWSSELEIDPLTLAYALVESREPPRGFAVPPPDDVVLLRFQSSPEIPLSDQFQPLIRENYAGDEIDQIDEMEAVWRRSLVFALEAELGERIFDLLICLREAVINALVHGCERQPGKVCTLSVSYRASDQRVRVRVDDPGKGHRFSLRERLAQLPQSSGKQLGLGLIQHLSDEVSFVNEGTSVVFDFLVSSPRHPHA